MLTVTFLETLAMRWRCSQLRFLLRWQSRDGAPTHASCYVGNVVMVLPATLLATLAKSWRCSHSRFLLRWQCGNGAPSYASCYVDNAVTVLHVMLLATLAMLWQCSLLRFLKRWLWGDVAPCYASCYVGNVVMGPQLRFLKRSLCCGGAPGYASCYVCAPKAVWAVHILWRCKNCLNPSSYSRSKKILKRGSNGIPNEKESATPQFPTNKSVTPDRFIEQWTVTVSLPEWISRMSNHPRHPVLLHWQDPRVSMRSALCWKASGSIN